MWFCIVCRKEENGPKRVWQRPNNHQQQLAIRIFGLESVAFFGSRQAPKARSSMCLNTEGDLYLLCPSLHGVRRVQTCSRSWSPPSAVLCPKNNFGRITYVRNTETENQQESKPSSCCILNFCSLQTTRAPEASQHEACTVL